MILDQREIINAICTHVSERKGIQPDQVEVGLEWNEELGFSAEITVDGRSHYMIEANMLEAIERYLHNTRNMIVYRSQLELDCDDDAMFCIIKQ
ncbi:MAG: hypothetical protein K0Q59_1637 [Paenibacillus sp.]|jgi:hypothetical protein|nr:hypothetical protein [Paenibacillus sp.]